MRFSASDGNWSQLSRNLKISTGRIYENWVNDFEDGVDVCRNVLKGDDHPQIKVALKQLGELADTREDLFEKLKRQVEEVAKRVSQVHRERSASKL